MTLSGDFTATVDYPLPLPVEAPPCKFTVEPSSKKPIMLTLPVQKVQSSTGIDPDCPAICAFDSHPETCLATAKPPKNGDLVVVQLSKQLAGISELALNIGDPLTDNPDNDGQLPGSAVLEISTDGTTFEAAGELTESDQIFSLDDKAITAFRIRFTSDWTTPFRLAEVEPQTAGEEGEAEEGNDGEDANGEDDAEEINPDGPVMNGQAEENEGEADEEDDQ
jgi:hypothetical protein